MTDMLNIGASGVRAYQAALNTTSENIANASSAGYSRRSVAISEVGRTNSIRLGQSTNLTGNGATVTGIDRPSDGFRIAEVRTSGADLARTETGVVWLDRVESALTGNQLGERLTAFFNAGKAVAADPSASAPRAVMLENAASLASAFAGTGRAIDAAESDLSASGEDAAKSLTELGDSLKKINIQLGRGDDKSTAHAQLLDERDRLIEGMSALVDVDVSTDGLGRSTVRAGGAAGPPLVDIDGSGLVTFVTNTSGAASFAVHRPGTTQTIPAHGGAFAGITDGAAKIAGARANLDDLAARFVDGVNTVQAGGVDLTNTAGAKMFDAPADKPTEISLVLGDPRKVAAAKTGEGVRGNGNMTDFASLRTDGAFEGGLADTTSANAAALSARRDVATAQTSIHAAAVTARDGVSGVDLDEEAVNLIRFQQAYQASSRVIQVARDTLQTIIDIR